MKKISFITTCSARKARGVTLGARIQNVERGNQESVLQEWTTLVRSTVHVVPLRELYTGRAIRMMKDAAEAFAAPLFIVSAGLGLVDICERKPGYDLTISGKGPSSVVTRIETGHFDASSWWGGVNQNDFTPIANLVRRSADTLFVLALSSQYYSMIRRDLESLEPKFLEHLRITGVKENGDTPLARCMLPYDDRFNGPDSPLPGTLSDFSQRCAFHYVKHCRTGLGQKADREVVLDLMQKMSLPTRSAGKKLCDSEILKIIRREFERYGLMKTKMLRHFRDTLKISCEQKRFSNLYDVTVRQINEKNY